MRKEYVKSAEIVKSTERKIENICNLHSSTILRLCALIKHSDF